MAKKRKKQTSRGRQPGGGAARPYEVRAIAVKASTFLFTWQTACVFAAILVVGIAAYSNTFRVPFIFDDHPQIETNQAIRSLSGVLHGPPLTRLIGYFSFAVNYAISGLGVTSYHVFNLVVHLLVAVLVFSFVSLTLRAPFIANAKLHGRAAALILIPTFTALLFVAHPIQTEAVTYIFQRLTSLAALFYLLALVTYAKSRLLAEGGPRGNTIRRGFITGSLYAVALASTFVAMMTKENAFTLPVAILLWEMMFMDGAIKKRLLRVAPFFVPVIAVPILLAVQNAPLLEAPGVAPAPSHLAYLFTQFRVIVTYIRLLFVPNWQNLDYDYPLYDHLLDPSVLLSLLLLLTLAGGSICLFILAKKNKISKLFGLAAFGIFWFFLTISVESSLISISDLILEHRLYLPSVGFLMAIVTVLAVAAQALRKKMRAVYLVLGSALSVLVIVFGGAAYARNSTWQDPITFWQDVVSKSPGKARPHVDLGNAYFQAGRIDDALREDLAGLAIDPNQGLAHLNVAEIYMNRKQYDDAIGEFQLALEADSSLAPPHDGLGYIHLIRGETDQAEAEFKAALTLDPNFSSSHRLLGGIYERRGQLDDASKEYQAAIDSDPQMGVNYALLGRVYLTENRASEATPLLVKAIQLDLTNEQEFVYLGDAYAAQSQFQNATAAYQAALKLKPGDDAVKQKLQSLQSNYPSQINH